MYRQLHLKRISDKFFNGRLAPIFLGLFNLSAQAHEVSIQSESVSNRGFMTNGYWQAQNLSTRDTPVIGYADQYLRAQAQVGVYGLFIEKRTTASFVGNNNALVLAANNNASLDTRVQGKIDIKAQFKSFEFDALGLQMSSAPDQSFRWSVSPKLISLNKFTSGSGSGTYTNQGGNQTLNGDTIQEGMLSYGFKRDTYAMTLSQGFSVDAAIEGDVGPSLWSVQATNLYSDIPARGIYFSNDKYQVSKTGDRFNFLQNAPVTGTYGQTDKSLTLPQIIRSTYQYRPHQSRWSGKLGGITIEGQTIPWVGVGYQRASVNLEMNAYDMEVVQWVIHAKDLIKPGFDIKFSVSVVPQGQTQSAFTSVSYSF